MQFRIIFFPADRYLKLVIWFTAVFQLYFFSGKFNFIDLVLIKNISPAIERMRNPFVLVSFPPVVKHGGHTDLAKSILARVLFMIGIFALDQLGIETGI